MNELELRAIARMVRGVVTRAIADELERLSEFRYCGVWAAEREYKPGNFVTHAGALWHCNAPTLGSDEPPPSGDLWTLAVKNMSRGRSDG